MYWLNLKALENQISNNELTEKDGFNYLLGYSILTTIIVTISSVSIFQNKTGLGIALLEVLISVIITILGLKAVYKANKEKDGKDFIKRYFAISWVIGFRLFLVLIGLIIIFGFVIGLFSAFQGHTHLDNTSSDEIITIIIGTLVTIICYLFTIISFRRLKLNTKE